MKDFFISYTGVDRRWAEWIAWQLEEAGYSVLIQAWDFVPGVNFVLSMDKSAREAACVIAVLSEDYLRSGYAAAEWASAFQDDPTSENRKLLPVRVRECDVKGLLGSIVYVDLLGLKEEDAKNVLIKAVRGERTKPAAPPRFPMPAHRAVVKRPRFPELFPNVELKKICEIEQDPSITEADKIMLGSVVESASISDKLVPLIEQRMKLELEMSALRAKKRSPQSPISTHALDLQLEDSQRKLDGLEAQIATLQQQGRSALDKMKTIEQAGLKHLRKLWSDR
jgi:hypothetical protein